MADDMSNDMIQDFLIEADEHISSLEQNLLAIEDDPAIADNVINEIFRSAHTIKGMSGMMGFNNLNMLTHKMENVLDKLRNKTLLPNTYIIDILFACLDTIIGMITSIKTGGTEEGIEVSELITKLENILEGNFEEPKKQVKVKNTDTKPSDTEKTDDADQEDDDDDEVNNILQDPEIIASVREETDELLEQYMEDVQRLENFADESPNRSILDSIFRSMHTLKGLSAMFGFNKISNFAHKLENILDSILNNRLIIDEPIYELLLSSGDVFYALVKELDNPESNIDLKDMYKYLNKLSATTKEKTVEYYDIPKKIFNVLSDNDINLISKAHKEKNKLYLIKISIKDEIIQTENIQVIVDKLNLFGKVVCIVSETDTAPDLEHFDPENFAVEFFILVISSDSMDVIKEVFAGEIEDVKELKRKRKKAKKKKNPPMKNVTQPVVASTEKQHGNKTVSDTAKQKNESAVSQTSKPSLPAGPPKVVSNTMSTANIASTTVRVDIDRLDKLMNLVGELVIDRTRLHQLIYNLSEKYTNEEGFANLHETTERMARITNELRESIMQVRMVPIGNVFKKFPRVVRDLSKARGKELDIVMSGETTELDKTIIEEISDPMIHLIRNAIDHGIEDPVTRKNVGKKPKGTLNLNAYHEGNHIIIEIGDDGAGLNPDKIKEVAIKKGVATKEELDKMTDNEINYLIFRAGFSTAEKVTDISGRGVGMDVVSSNIKKLNGIIEIDSKVGKGTKFIIKLPLTLAIINALLIKVGDQTLAIPLAQVIESVIITPDQIKTMEEREEVVVLRERVVTLLRLSKFFKIRESEEINKKKKIFVVIVGLAEEKIGIVVDSLLGQQEIVIKSLDSDMIDVKGIAGATILGEGNVVLILDVATLIYENRNVMQKEQEEA